jgi:hypothetical protein
MKIEGMGIRKDERKLNDKFRKITAVANRVNYRRYLNLKNVIFALKDTRELLLSILK